MTWFASLVLSEETTASAGQLLARLVQLLIGVVELAAGVLLLWGVFDATRRRQLLDAGYAILVLLFSGFMLTLFIIHHNVAGLPAWNQYPAILAMLLVGWYLATRESTATA